MSTIKTIFKRKSFLATVIVLIAIFASVSNAGMHLAAAAGTGPADIYTAAGNTVGAAHSTVRALYGAYSGRLYQVKRASNGNTMDIGTLSAGGFANAAAQDSFCAGTTCTITIIYDQSPRGNHLTPAPAGGVCGADTPANATNESITLNGNKVYSLKTNPGNGYRDNTTTGIPTGSASAGTYAIFAGNNFNSGCCYDYGNAETNNLDDGDGTMGALYFGNATAWGRGAGSGPWVMADLENGLFAGGTVRNTAYSANAGNSSRYVSAFLKNSSTNYAIRAGNAASGGLSTWYNGALPNYSGYRPLKLQGAIILGIGGDNSCSARGTFYEGVMVAGWPSDATENSVQANVAAVYGGAGAGPTPTPGPTSPPGTYVKLVNKNVAKCVDVQQPNTSDGANVDLYTCNGNTWQNWQLVDLGTGYYHVVSQNSGKCLDVNGASTADGANVIQWACGSGTNQQWQKVTTTAPWFRLVARHSGKVLDVNGCGTADGTNIQQWTWLNNNCQQWQTQ
jgi:hypothetical protein